ncbi:MAG: threonine--tRNA ligase [Candidatus Anstonellales archaeon]
MKVLLIHADSIEVHVREKAIKNPEEAPIKHLEANETLVVFTAVEKGDTADTAKRMAKDAAEVMRQVKAESFFLYPLVHLTSNPASPSTALSILNECSKELSNYGEVKRAPFGWYKAYALKCKGHPLSELSREYKAEGAEEVVSQSLKKESTVKSEFFVLTPKGELIKADQFDYSKYPELKKLVTYETKKVRSYEKEPPHIGLMKKHWISDHEPGSDPGNLRWYPKGRLIKKALEEEVTKICLNEGALEVETPVMYDFEHPSLKKYLNRFPARQYLVISEDKKLFLRFAACFGQFLISHDLPLTYRHLPLKLYELTHYSFRREQSGELAGLKRLRAFTMPDMHTIARDMEQAKGEFAHQFDLCIKWMESLGLENEVAFRAHRQFFEENKEWYLGFVRKVRKPIMLELFDERYAYFITKFELNFIDGMEKATALSTVQIDVENSETYDINFVDEDGAKKRPLILHASISGGIDRVVYALLEKQAMLMEKGQKAMLQLWLSPVQLRIVPVKSEYVEDAKFLLKRIEGRKVRADVDDREETLSKKIRQAEMEWVPYVAVLGESELKSGMLSVNERETGKKLSISLEDLVELIEKKTEGHAFAQLTFPNLMSKRPF